MNKKILLASLGLTMVATTFMQSCSDDDDTPGPATNDIVVGRVYAFTYSNMVGRQLTYTTTDPAAHTETKHFIDLPDFEHWHYLALDSLKGIRPIEKDTFELENISNKVGTEKISETWKNRKDWDIALHAYDIRTNSGTAARLGNTQAVIIHDATSSKNLPSEFAKIKNASGYSFEPNQTVTGTFYQSFVDSIKTNTLDICKFLIGGRSQSLATFETKAPYKVSVNPMVVLFKTTQGKYFKVYFKDFQVADKNKPNLSLEYALIPEK